MAPGKKKPGYGWSEQGQLQNIALPPKMKCGFCLKNKPHSAFSNNQLDDARAAVYTRKAYVIKCMPCSATQVHELECKICGKFKPLDEFSKTHRRNPDDATCMKCMDAHLTLPEPNAPAAKQGGVRDHSDEDSSDADFNESSDTSSVSNSWEDASETSSIDGLGRMSLKDFSNQQSDSSHLSSALKGAFSRSKSVGDSESISTTTKGETVEGSEWQTATYSRNRSYANTGRPGASITSSASVMSKEPWDITQDPDRYRNSANPSPSAYTNDNRRFPKLKAYKAPVLLEPEEEDDEEPVVAARAQVTVQDDSDSEEDDDDFYY